jgi:signal transduction histidine kinase
MRKAQPIQQYFLRTILRYAGIGLAFICLTSFAVSFFLTRAQMATDLQESAIATAQAFHDSIFDGDIHLIEPQIGKLLKIQNGESAQILNQDLSRIYDPFTPTEKVNPCPRVGFTCFDGYFGKARILVPISLSSDGGSASRYLYLSKQIHLNWSYLVTVFSVFVLGYLGLLFAFLRISKLTSAKLGAEILNWSDRLRSNPKDTTPLTEPPFAELQPLRQALEGLNTQIEKFEKTATDKARLLLLRGIAHDLLTPVARLQLYIGTLEKVIDGVEHADTMDEIRDSLTSVTAIASQVKTLNDLDTPVEHTELVAATHQEIRSLRDSKALGAKSIKLEFHSAVPNLISPFSRTEIARILSNLVQNAAHASATGAVVNIEVGQNSSGPFLSVKDGGSGIPEYALERVFDPDYTLKPGTGTGLGLAIVKYICEQRSAQIELQSQINTGTTVTIRLPEMRGVHV